MYEVEDLRRLSEVQEPAPPPVDWTDAFLQRHHLMGLAYNKSGDKKYFGQWKSQLTRNFVVRDELEILGRELVAANIDVCLLKGYALMGDIYEDWGQRFASDVDWLVGVSDLWRISDLLLLNGYRKIFEKKWLGNRFKFLYGKKVGNLDICIEVHTQMFWHSSLDGFSDARAAEIKGFKILGHETQLMHLCGHLGFQHTYLKLFWLVDIFKYVEKYRNQIHWPRFWNLALQQGLYKSSVLSLRLCQKLGLDVQMELAKAPQKHQWSLAFLQRVATLNFLYDPRKKRVRYYIIKYLIKDSFRLNIKYTLQWFFRK